MRIKGVVAAVAAALAVLTGTLADAKDVAVSAERLLDVATGKYIEHPVVLISDGRIVGISNPREPLRPGTTLVDLPGVTLLPGLIDMHVHLTSSPLFGGYNRLQMTDSFWPILATTHAKATLEAGFTTVRNVGSRNFEDVGLKQAIDGGFIPGPRIVPAGYAIGSTGGHCDSNSFPPSMHQKGDAVIDSPDEGRRRVREMHKYGAEVIKICATGGVFSHGDTPGAQQLTLEEIKAMVEEAHRAGMKVAAHAHGADGIKAAILGGVDTIEHASLVDDEGIRLAIAHGSYFGMDIYNTDYTQAEGKKNGVLEENLKKDRDIGEIQRENFRKALKAGVKMIFSTDAGVYPHGTNARQFAVMVRYGATPLQAIQTATLNAAQALDRVKDVGQATPGHYGDLVGVIGDPLSDVTVLEHPVFVMKGGEVVKKAP
ncbi:metal-dependent hydrolase family protein [Phenylobacterium sp.]|jgi:imidazolonepropionase-like amidohydrolase|uniref:Xaa-Pro dipeptidase n=1 Tax=Phenylobacterium sp. TaxID=1871053 RepID=UPI002F40F675